MRIKLYFALVFFIVCILFVGNVDCYIHPIGEDEYEVLLSLANGNFQKPVKDRTNVEKSAVIKFWRAKGRFTVDDSGRVLLFDNKKVGPICLLTLIGMGSEPTHFTWGD